MKLNARVRKLELELIQPHMAQKPLLRGEVGCACVAREVSVEKGGMGKKRKHQINRSTLPALRPLRRALLSARGGLFYSFLDPIPPPSLGGRKQLLLRLPLPLISLRLPLKEFFSSQRLQGHRKLAPTRALEIANDLSPGPRGPLRWAHQEGCARRRRRPCWRGPWPGGLQGSITRGFAGPPRAE